MVDGQGIAHPRRFGLASHLGLFTGIPAIGCAKTRLIGEYQEPQSTRGSIAYLTDAETPHTLTNNSTYLINVSTYHFPLDGSPIIADIVLIDVSGNENLTYLEYAVASGGISGQRIALTNESSNLSSAPATVQENA